MSDWKPIKLVEDHPDSARIKRALAGSGAYRAVMTRPCRYYVGDEEDTRGCLTVYRETDDDEAEFRRDNGSEDEVIGLAVPDGRGGWYLGCLICQDQLPGPDRALCPVCRSRSAQAPRAAR